MVQIEYFTTNLSTSQSKWCLWHLNCTCKIVQYKSCLFSQYSCICEREVCRRVWIAGLNRCTNQCTLFELLSETTERGYTWCSNRATPSDADLYRPAFLFSTCGGTLNMSHTQLANRMSSQEEISFNLLNKLIVIKSKQILQHYNKKIIFWGLILTDFLIHFILNYCDVHNILYFRLILS